MIITHSFLSHAMNNLLEIISHTDESSVVQTNWNPIALFWNCLGLWHHPNWPIFWSVISEGHEFVLLWCSFISLRCNISFSQDYRREINIILENDLSILEKVFKNHPSRISKVFQEHNEGLTHLPTNFIFNLVLTITELQWIMYAIFP